jgi:hypothetical protein
MVSIKKLPPWIKGYSDVSCTVLRISLLFILAHFHTLTLVTLLFVIANLFPWTPLIFSWSRPHLAWVHPWLWQRKRVRKSTRPWERQTNRQTQTETDRHTDNNCSHFEVSTPQYVYSVVLQDIYFLVLYSQYKISLALLYVFCKCAKC